MTIKWHKTFVQTFVEKVTILHKWVLLITKYRQLQGDKASALTRGFNCPWTPLGLALKPQYRLTLPRSPWFLAPFTKILDPSQCCINQLVVFYRTVGLLLHLCWLWSICWRYSPVRREGGFRVRGRPTYNSVNWLQLIARSEVRLISRDLTII